MTVHWEKQGQMERVLGKGVSVTSAGVVSVIGLGQCCAWFMLYRHLFKRPYSRGLLV